MDSYSDVRLFALIVKLGNMAAAAQELGVTPPVISRRLALLEKRLGVRLLNRTTRKISLTPEGETYLMEGVRLLEEMEALEGSIAGGRLQPQGTVKIAATFGFGRTYVTPALSSFVREFPKIDVQLHLSEKSVNLVDQGFDLMIRFGELADSRLTARLLARNRRILCAAPSYLSAMGTPAHPRDLGRHSCIFIREADETFGTWHFSHGDESETVKVRSRLSTNDGNSALSWALDGQGILIRSQWEVAQHLRQGELLALLPEWSTPPADIYLVFQTGGQVPAKVRVLVDWLLKYFEPRRAVGKNDAKVW